jgi:phosphocarrier protein HPr
MKTFTYTVKDKNGIHARPAGLLVRESQKFSSQVTISSEGNKGDLKKLFAVLGMNVKQGTLVTITLEGEDEAAAQTALQAYFAKNL